MKGRSSRRLGRIYCAKHASATLYYLHSVSSTLWRSTQNYMREYSSGAMDENFPASAWSSGSKDTSKWQFVTSLFFFFFFSTIVMPLYFDIIGISPFYLYPNLAKPWMCAVCIFCTWYDLTRKLRISQTGYLFWKKIGCDQVSSWDSDSIVSDLYVLSYAKSLFVVSKV